MSLCSADEIAEKKRIAQQKLQAKKQRLTSNAERNNNSPSVSNGASNHQISSAASAFLNALKRGNVQTYGEHSSSANSISEKCKQSTVPHKPTLSVSPPKPVVPVFGGVVTCKLYMVSPCRFALESPGYQTQMVETLKTIPSKSYDTHTRIWTFALTDYQLLQDRLSCMKPHVVVGTIPKNVLNLCLAPPKELNRTCLASIQTTLGEKLMPFQQDGVCFAIAQHGRAMICDEMGLGKTYQALAVADFYREDWPLLICTTASTRETWANQIRELLPNIPVHYIQVLINNQQYIGDTKVLVTSYNMMERNSDILLEKKFGFLIFDESHTLKNSKAKCTIVADRLSQRAKHVLLLSGTPALSRPLELFSQLQMIDRKFLSFMDFTSRYCDGKQTNFGWDATGQSNLQELNVVLKLKYMIRRTKADVLPQLADKSRETVNLDAALVWSNNETKEYLSQFAKDFLSSKGKEKEEILLKFYARTAEVKTRAVCAYVKSLLKETKKFIIFAHHRVMLDAICDCIFKAKVNFVRIDGSTKNEARAEYVKTFQNKSSCQVAVLSLKACNSGITLTAAELIVFAELDWNPSTLAQAESRAHRIGQLKPVTCRYLMASKTADDIIWNMLKSKQDVLNSAGLFCENLQEATNVLAPISSNKIINYFTPTKTAEGNDMISKEELPNPKKLKLDTDLNDEPKIQKQSKDVDELLKEDDDDEAFLALDF